jgi:sucrose-6-phosphate hydrolase SacC (GH32 family)
LFDCNFSAESNVSNKQTVKANCKFYSHLWEASWPSSSYKTNMVECPDLYPVQSSAQKDSLFALKYSIMEDRREIYELGTYDEVKGLFAKQIQTFNNGGQYLEYDFGPNNQFYASKSFLYSEGSGGNSQRILWGWTPEADDSLDRTWSGAMALPRQVKYSEVWKCLLFQPFAGLTALRNPHQHYVAHMNNLIINGHDSAASGEYVIPLPVNSLTTEVRAIFHMDFSVMDSDNGDCQIEVGFLSRTEAVDTSSYEKVSKQLPTYYAKHAIALKHDLKDIRFFSVIDTTKVQTTSEESRKKITKSFPGDINAWLEAQGNHDNVQQTSYGIDFDIAMFFDHSVVEMYAVEGVSTSTTRIYSPIEYQGLSVYVRTCNNSNQHVVLHSIEAWGMNSIWEK